VLLTELTAYFVVKMDKFSLYGTSVNSTLNLAAKVFFKSWYPCPKMGLYFATTLMAQTLKSKGQTNFSFYSRRSCVATCSNKQGLVASVAESTLAIFIHCCYFVKNEKHLLCSLPKWKRQRSVGPERKNFLYFSRTELKSGTFRRPCRPQTTILFHGQSWRVAPSGARADHRPLYDSCVWVEVSGAVRGIVACKGYYWIVLDSMWNVLLLHTDRKQQVFKVACDEKGHCTNACGMGSSNSSLSAETCVCASIMSVSEIIPQPVDNNRLSEKIQ
jgi:hypothetical protein